jgi:hypothetical protein
VSSSPALLITKKGALDSQPHVKRHIFSRQIPQFFPKDNDFILSIVNVLIAKQLIQAYHQYGVGSSLALLITT